jgi:hypothetical protein
MRSVGSAALKPSTNGLLPGPIPSWRCSGVSGCPRVRRSRAFSRSGIVNLFISTDELSPFRGFFGLIHRDSSRKEAEKTFLFPTFQEKYSHHCMKLTIPHTHLTRLIGGAALPLTLFPQGAGATTADAGRIDHAQTSIDLSSPLVDAQGLPSRATQGCAGYLGHPFRKTRNVCHKIENRQTFA